MANDWYKRVLGELNKHIGKRVRVKHSDKYRRYDVKGCFGTIMVWYGNTNIAVRLDNLSNRGSSYGYFYFEKNELEIIENNNEIMEETTMAINTNHITNYLNTAKVVKSDGRTYYFANYILDLNPGDSCVVVTDNHDMTVAVVAEIIHENNEPMSREVVCKIDTTDYKARVEARKKAAELKQKMQERAKKLQDIAIYKMLAEKDDEMAQLLADYTNLGSV